MSEPVYVYLQPEMKEKWYITLAITTLVGFLIAIMIWAFKKYWELNTCGLGPNIGSVFGLSSTEWTETCIGAPLEGTINEIKHKAELDKATAIKPLKTLLEKIQDHVKSMITRTNVATNQLKKAKAKK